MAQWTDPKTMTQGAAALSADWNTYIRDNIKYLKDRVEIVEDRVEIVEDRVEIVEDRVEIVEDRVQIVTQAEYDGIVPDPETIYIIVG